jgi:predicted SnoaL-like aldol condensation-catalyzing enzyme
VAGADAYIRFFATLQPDRLDLLDALTTPDVAFHDPFNDLHGRPALRRLLAEMFEQLEQPRFDILRHAADGDVHFVRWRFTGRRPGRSELIELEGVSELHVDADGRVRLHIDHWDAARQLYERVPVLGWLLRRIRRRLAVSAPPPSGAAR